MSTHFQSSSDKQKNKQTKLSSKNCNSPVIIMIQEAILRNRRDQPLYIGRPGPQTEEDKQSQGVCGWL